jgi:hypothetical protein
VNIYLAGASEEAKRCADAMAQLRALGHEITEDWTTSVLKHGPDEKCDLHTLFAAARRNARGVNMADLMIVLVPAERGSIGWSFEMGIAEQCGIAIWWVGRKQSCFWTFASQCFDTFEDVITGMRISR